MPTAEELIAAVENGDSMRVAAIVDAMPALASARNVDGISVLMLSRYRSNRAVTDALLAADPDLDVYEAAALGYLDRLRERLEEDPSRLRALSADGYTALHLAAFFAKPEAARILIEAGAPIDVVADNEMRVQPLHSAAAGRQPEICRMLLAAGADVDAREAGGFTPLHAAAQNGGPEMVELFLSAGADATATTDDGKTAAQIAEEAGHPDVARRLREVMATGAVG
ncbi:MAG TPA: ankyrin repeat domain-containing protein [Candidatus Limnocylindrales bacterium]|nr:ankyrin repeat domain-containing protein [Candidatus Limnocylindrales bacterium]